MRRSRLGRKIFICMLAVSLGVVIFIYIAAYIQMSKMVSAADETGEKISEVAADRSSDELILLSKQYMTRIAAANAAKHNITFNRVAGEISGISGTITSLYEEPGKIAGFIPPEFGATKDGELMGRGTVVQGVDRTQDIMNELQTISGAEYSAKEIYDSDDIINNILIGTESGLFYRYSDYNSFNSDYDPRVRDWYVNAINNPGKIMWSDAYVDSYGKNVVTCSVTFNDEAGNVAGVVASDILIEDMLSDILDSEINDEYSFILNEKGFYIAHPSFGEEGFVMRPVEEGNDEIAYIVNKMRAGNNDCTRYEEGGETMYVAYAPISGTGWSLGMVFSEKSVTSAVETTKVLIANNTQSAQKEMRQLVKYAERLFNLVVLLCIVLVAIISYVLAMKIKRPIDKVIAGAKRMGKGDLDTTIEVVGNDEIASLGNSFNMMAADLKNYIRNLTEVTMERERIGAELDVATKIQGDMLPSIFPAFPQREEFDLFASMNPAKEVGGDFYDFFMTDDTHLALVIADVSGKGVPAALFMVISKTLIKNEAQNHSSPSEILERVNRQLCENNGEEMFVTVWLGIVDITCGKMTCVNAGHEYPIIKRNGGEFEVLKDKHGFVLGGMEFSKYRDYEISLEKGDTLFVYTDGVPEAQNSDNDLFGLERTCSALNENSSASPREIITNLKVSIDEFAGDAAQFDDITMLCYTQMK